MRKNTTTNTRVADFARRFPFPGWYMDVTGRYCCVVGEYLISIFVNNCDGAMEIAVDAMGEDGLFDQNMEWESPEDDTKLAEAAMRLAAQYANQK